MRPRSPVSMATYLRISLRRLGIARGRWVFRTAVEAVHYSQTLPHLLGRRESAALVAGVTMIGTCQQVPADAYVIALAQLRGWNVWPGCGTMSTWRTGPSWPTLVSNFVKRTEGSTPCT